MYPSGLYIVYETVLSVEDSTEELGRGRTHIFVNRPTEFRPGPSRTDRDVRVTIRLVTIRLVTIAINRFFGRPRFITRAFTPPRDQDFSIQRHFQGS